MSTMRYRKLSPTGDYVFGQSAADFYLDIEAVQQAIKTRLTLDKGSFWRDLEAGLPLTTEILGSPGSQSNLLQIDNIITEQIQGTTGVDRILNFSSEYDRTNRVYSYRAQVQTIYSTTVIIEGTL